MVELNRVDEVQRFRTYKIYGKHHLPHYGEHKLVATIHMNTGDNSLADCENLPVLFMNAQTYRDDAMRLRSEMEQKDREISRLQADADLVERMRRRMEDIEALCAENERLIKAGDGDAGLIHWQGERIQKLETALREIARLRTDLRGDFSLGSKQSDIARAALGEKQ